MVTRILADANVLYSRTLRDWLLQLQIASAGAMFTTCWTEDIRAEVLYHLRKENPDMDGAALTRVADRIAGSMTERIEDYRSGADAPVADQFDRHVHAAAVAGQVDILMTNDIDFLNLAEDVADRLPYDICTADQVFVLIDDSHPHLVREVTQDTWDYWRRRSPDADVPERLKLAGCPDFADRVRDHIVAMR